MRLPSDKEFNESLADVRRHLRRISSAWSNYKLGPLGDGATLSDVYREAENAQHAAFDLKQLFVDFPPVLDAPHVRRWFLNLEPTHGEKGLACVTLAYVLDPKNTNATIGPDEEYYGTAYEVTSMLRGRGYTTLDTDVEELRKEWTKSANRP